MVIVLFSGNGCAPKMTKEVNKIMLNLTLEQKIGQLLLIAVPGDSMSSESKEILKKYQPGGILFFKYNIAGKDKFAQYIADLQNEIVLDGSIPLITTIDQEGGRVKRITDGVTQFPGAMAWGVADDPELAYEAARVLGLELRQLGINMNLAPVLDVNNNPDNPVINIRSIGSDPDVVTRIGCAYIKGLQDSNCAAVGKHFPGHGDTNTDSHYSLPIIKHDMTHLKNLELVPFRQAIDKNVAGIMSAHLAFPTILNSDVPATLSPFFLTEVLRKELSFNGIVMTDDLEMHGASGNKDIGDVGVEAFMAGADMLLLSSWGASVDKIYKDMLDAVRSGKISEQRINESVKRILEVKLRYGVMRYDKDRVISIIPTLSEEDKLLLSRSGEINSALSAKAIMHYQSENLLFPEITAADHSYVITDNSKFAALVNEKSDGKIKVVSSVDSVPSSDRNMGSLLFYMGNINNSVNDQLVKSGMRVIYLVINNPFSLKNLATKPEALLSFSDTDQSFIELANCVAGLKKPNEKVNLNLGFTQ